DILEPPHRRAGFLVRRAITGEEQMMQSAEQVGQPELGVRRVRPQFLVAAHGDADLVEQRRAVDLLVQPVDAGFFERGRERLEGREVRRQRGGTEAAVAVIVARHAGLRRRDGVQVPPQVEERPLDRAEGHAFSNRWHSSSDSTRSVRLAASKSTLQAASFSESYPCSSSQYFTF